MAVEEFLSEILITVFDKEVSLIMHLIA